jgi:predicted nicotinamide N-methyase
MKSSSAGPNSIVHDLVVDSIPVKVQEQVMASSAEDSILGQEEGQDTTGLGLWAASLICAQWLARLEIQGSVLELGAGCGLPSLLVALKGNCTVTATDFNPRTVANCETNIELNQLVNCTAMELNWKHCHDLEPVSTLIGSDLVYQSDMVPLLVQTIQRLLLPGGRFLYVAPVTGRKGHKEFLDQMMQHFTYVVKPAPEEYSVNPLASQDDDECFLLFNELKLPHNLYEFTWKR